MALPRTKVFSDVHCVTTWSRLDNLWEGVQAKALQNVVRIRPEARFAIIHAHGDFTTNLSLDDLFQEDVLFATAHNGQPITPQQWLSGQTGRSQALISGRAQNGSQELSSRPLIVRVFGRVMDITCEAIPGRRSVMVNFFCRQSPKSLSKVSTIRDSRVAISRISSSAV